MSILLMAADITCTTFGPDDRKVRPSIQDQMNATTQLQLEMMRQSQQNMQQQSQDKMLPLWEAGQRRLTSFLRSNPSRSSGSILIPPVQS